MTKDDVLALPAAIRTFNGFYTVHGRFTLENSIRILIAFGVLVLVNKQRDPTSGVRAIHREFRPETEDFRELAQPTRSIWKSRSRAI